MARYQEGMYDKWIINNLSIPIGAVSEDESWESHNARSFDWLPADVCAIDNWKQQCHHYSHHYNHYNHSIDS